MKKLHFIFSKEGAITALGLKSLESLNYYIRKAKKLGVIVSKTIGGIELYDIDCLEYPEDHLPKKSLTMGKQLSFEF